MKSFQAVKGSGSECKTLDAGASNSCNHQMRRKEGRRKDGGVLLPRSSTFEIFRDVMGNAFQGTDIPDENSAIITEMMNAPRHHLIMTKNFPGIVAKLTEALPRRVIIQKRFCQSDHLRSGSQRSLLSKA